MAVKKDVKTAAKAVKEEVKETAKTVEKTVEKAVKKAAPAAKKAATATKKAATATKKAAAAAKKTITKPTEEVYLEFGGKSVSVSEIVENVKKAFKADNKKASVKKVQVYIKPETNEAYYVVNDIAEGKKIDL